MGYAMGIFLRNLRRGLIAPAPGERWRGWVFLLAVVFLIVASLLASPLFPGVREWLNGIPILTSILVSIALVAAGIAGWFVGDAERSRRRDQSISSAGMAALVAPLVEIGWVLRQLDVNPTALEAGLNCGSTSGPSGQPLRIAPRLKCDYVRALPSVEVEQAVETQAKAVATVTEVTDQAVRRLMASLRSWADLLARTSSGLQAMDVLNGLRHELARPWAGGRLKPRKDSNLGELTELGDRALTLAVVFEFCGGAAEPRRQLLKAISPEAGVPGLSELSRKLGAVELTAQQRQDLAFAELERVSAETTDQWLRRPPTSPESPAPN